MIRRPPRSTLDRSSAASDVYKRQALTVLAIVVAYTPLFDVIVSGWLDVPDEIARWVRPGMQIMIFWLSLIHISEPTRPY